MQASYVNAEGTDILLIEEDGTRLALKPGDPRLQAMRVEAFVPPPPPPQSVTDLLALREQIDAALAALPQDAA
jgi:hypothetical protein